MVLTAYFVLSPVIGLFCHRSNYFCECLLSTHSEVDNSAVAGGRMQRIAVGECLALFVVAFLHCTPARALMGADLADHAVHRYIVVVGSTKVRCTGVVLAQDVVLTAAHCAKDAEDLWIGGNLGGGYQTYPPFGLSRVTDKVEHPRYDPTQVGTPDLGILKLAKPLPSRFTPAFIEARPPKSGDDLIAAGYGKSAENDPNVGTALRIILLRASYRYSNYLTLTSTREDPAVGSPGDSGTPVFTYRGIHALVGIIVGGWPNFAVAVAIAPNYAWIKQTMEKLGGS
jgi:hypothetical protein